MSNYLNSDVIIVNTHNHIWDYRSTLKSLIDQNFLGPVRGDQLKALIEESIRQVFEILSKDFRYFTNQLQGRPVFPRLMGSWIDPAVVNPHAKIIIEKAWKEMALAIYFILVEQIGYSNSSFELALIQIYMDGLAMIKDYQYVK